MTGVPTCALPVSMGRSAMKRLSTIILATRPWSFSMTAISVTLGSIIILPEGGFRWELYLPVLLGMILVHAATNLANDYFDVKHGVDRRDSPTARYREHPLIEETLKPQHILYLSLVFYFAAGLLGLYLALVRGFFRCNRKITSGCLYHLLDIRGCNG